MKTTELFYGDLLYSEMHGRFVRVVKVHDESSIEVADRNTMTPLPDYCHPALCRKV